MPKYGKSKTTKQQQYRQKKKAEAIERQAKYDALTKEQKLALIKGRPGKSQKEHNKLIGETKHER